MEEDNNEAPQEVLDLELSLSAPWATQSSFTSVNSVNSKDSEASVGQKAHGPPGAQNTQAQEGLQDGNHPPGLEQDNHNEDELLGQDNQVPGLQLAQNNDGVNHPLQVQPWNIEEIPNNALHLPIPQPALQQHSNSSAPPTNHQLNINMVLTDFDNLSQADQGWMSESTRCRAHTKHQQMSTGSGQDTSPYQDKQPR